MVKFDIDYRYNRLISHRGNVLGPNPSKENHPEYILNALKNYDVEIDVWFENKNFYLGHDVPKYEVSKLFLFNEKFIIHAKSLETFLELEKYSDLEVFYQNQEDVVVTTQSRKVFHSRHTSPLNDQRGNIWIDLQAKQSFEIFGILNSVLTDYP